jgi:dipeptidase E
MVEPMLRRRIVALGGGGFSSEPGNPLLDDFILSLARSPVPKVCFVPTASGDSPEYVLRFYRAFSQRDCRPTDLQLFQRTVEDLAAFVLEQDVIYVGGGNTANLLAVWRTHGLDPILRQAWESGTVLCGISAGMNCWFAQSVTDSFNLDQLGALPDGLGLITASACPHYDGEPQRRPTFQQLVSAGRLMPGWAADDGAALVFAGDQLEQVVASRPTACGYRVEPRDGGVEEQRLPSRYLGK